MKKLFITLMAALIGGAAFAQSIYTKYTDCPEGAVDLGIVMTHEDGTTYKVYWGTCNIGANSPEETGEFFAWGELEQKATYEWSNYAFADTSMTVMTKYHVPEPDKYIGPAMRLDLEDDVAHARLQGTWRMPTMGEWMALQNQCDWVYEKNGKHGGYRVTSRENPENSIFLPIGGMMFNDVLFDYGGDPYANYWSSNVCLNTSTSAWYFTFSRLIFSKAQGANYRYYGFNVRPVAE